MDAACGSPALHAPAAVEASERSAGQWRTRGGIVSSDWAQMCCGVANSCGGQLDILLVVVRASLRSSRPSLDLTARDAGDWSPVCAAIYRQAETRSTNSMPWAQSGARPSPIRRPHRWLMSSP
jgi:hypothetical protein